MVFISTIIPTVGRSSLARAVESVLQQDFSQADFEVLVVNDSGKPLPKADWQKSKHVQIIATNKRERSIARNTGASIARGHYLHFLDDDDCLAPGAFQSFWELSQFTDAKWLYGITQLLDRQSRLTIQLKHGLQGNAFLQAMAGEWIPIQSSLIERKTFMRLGGFNSLLTGPEDIDLLRRVLLEEDIAETPNLVAYVIRGEEGSTTNYNRHSMESRWARENILDAPNSVHRMQLSADNEFWRARMLRIHLTSVLWNLQNRRFFRAVSRVFSSTAILLNAGTGVFSKKYWREVSKPYDSITFAKGIQNTRKEI